VGEPGRVVDLHGRGSDGVRRRAGVGTVVDHRRAVVAAGDDHATREGGGDVETIGPGAGVDDDAGGRRAGEGALADKVVLAAGGAVDDHLFNVHIADGNGVAHGGVGRRDRVGVLDDVRIVEGDRRRSAARVDGDVAAEVLHVLHDGGHVDVVHALAGVEEELHGRRRALHAEGVIAWAAAEG